MEPRVEQLPLPRGYGSPSEKLPWYEVSERLRAARVYWIASVKPDGVPHVVPRDGIWMHDSLYYGGSDETVHNRNIKRNPEVVMHVGEGSEAVIVEGQAVFKLPNDSEALEIATASFEKYPEYGQIDPQSYAAGLWVIRPKKVMAWTLLPKNATRYVFD